MSSMSYVNHWQQLKSTFETIACDGLPFSYDREERAPYTELMYERVVESLDPSDVAWIDHDRNEIVIRRRKKTPRATTWRYSHSINDPTQHPAVWRAWYADPLRGEFPYKNLDRELLPIHLAPLQEGPHLPPVPPLEAACAKAGLAAPPWSNKDALGMKKGHAILCALDRIASAILSHNSDPGYLRAIMTHDRRAIMTALARVKGSRHTGFVDWVYDTLSKILFESRVLELWASQLAHLPPNLSILQGYREAIAEAITSHPYPSDRGVKLHFS